MSENNIQAHIQPIDGKVVVTFPISISYLSMPPDQAEAFANLLLSTAKAALESNAVNAVPPGTHVRDGLKSETLALMRVRPYTSAPDVRPRITGTRAPRVITTAT